MSNRRALLTFAFLSAAVFLFAQAKDPVVDARRFLWPLLEGHGTVLMRPGMATNPVYGNVFKNADYFIAGEEGETVYAPEDGIVKSRIDYELSLPNNMVSYSFDSPSGFAEAKRKGAAPDFDEKCLTSCVGIALAGGRNLYILGLSSISVRKGDTVKRGDVLGAMGYIHTFSDEPCIKLSMSGVDLGMRLLGEDNSAFFKSAATEECDYKPYGKLTKNKALAAFDVFENCILQDHPALLDDDMRREAKKALHEARAAIVEGMRVRDLQRILKKASASLSCSHTEIYGNNEVYVPPLFPLVLSYRAGTCFVVWDKRGKGEIAPGTEVTAIDSMPIAMIAAELKSLEGFDAQSEAVKDESLERRFDILYERSFELGKSVKLRLRDASGGETTRELPSLSMSQAAAKTSLPPWYGEAKPGFEYLASNTAIMRLSSVDQAIDRRTYTEYFQALRRKGIENLIVDLRGNGGGEDDNCAFLYSFFAKSSFSTMEGAEPRHGGKYSSFEHSINMPSSGSVGTFSPRPYEPSRSDRFEGKVYVLVDCWTSSAAVNLARLLAEWGASTIGTETGGGFYACNAEKFNKVLLPGTGIVLKMPLLRCVFRRTEELSIPPNRGLIPLYIQPRSLSDILDNTDSQLDLCLSLIKDDGKGSRATD